jgi:hypothetical protein
LSPPREKKGGLPGEVPPAARRGRFGGAYELTRRLPR